jgi:hypothetical protein
MSTSVTPLYTDDELRSLLVRAESADRALLAAQAYLDTYEASRWDSPRADEAEAGVWRWVPVPYRCNSDLARVLRPATAGRRGAFRAFVVGVDWDVAQAQPAGEVLTSETTGGDV